MVGTSSEIGSPVANTGDGPFTLRVLDYIPFLEVNLISCTRYEEKGVRTSITKCYCRLYHKPNGNSLFDRIRRENGTDSLWAEYDTSGR